MMKRILFFFFSLLLLAACKPSLDQNDLISIDSSGDTHQNEDNIKPISGDRLEGVLSDHSNQKDTLRYLALGDSYTIGESVSPAERWPNQLAERVNDQSEEFHFLQPQIIAQTGWTTSNLSNAMDQQEVDSQEYDLVSLLIGVNNQYQGQALAQYLEEFPPLLQRAIDLAGGNPERVFVVSIPDYGYTPFGASNQANISASLSLYNEACAEMSANAGVLYYNITPISQQYPDTEGLIAPDGLHPSGYQYQLWVDSFWESLLEAL